MTNMPTICKDGILNIHNNASPLNWSSLTTSHSGRRKSGTNISNNDHQ